MSDNHVILDKLLTPQSPPRPPEAVPLVDCIRTEPPTPTPPRSDRFHPSQSSPILCALPDWGSRTPPTSASSHPWPIIWSCAPSAAQSFVRRRAGLALLTSSEPGDVDVTDEHPHHPHTIVDIVT